IAAAIPLNSTDASRGRADLPKIKPERWETQMMSYFPPQHPAGWEHSGPEMAGFDPTPLAAATSYVAEHETPWGRDLAEVIERGLIRDLHEPVRRTVDDGGFDGPHNGAITWHHLLQQTSEWEGELWGKPDLVDRNRSVGGRPAAAKKGTHRELQPPGTLGI